MIIQNVIEIDIRDPKSIARAFKQGITTPLQLFDYVSQTDYGYELGGNSEYLIMPGYYTRVFEVDTHKPLAESGLDAAHDFRGAGPVDTYRLKISERGNIVEFDHACHYVNDKIDHSALIHAAMVGRDSCGDDHDLHVWEQVEISSAGDGSLAIQYRCRECGLIKTEYCCGRTRSFYNTDTVTYRAPKRGEQ